MKTRPINRPIGIRIHSRHPLEFSSSALRCLYPSSSPSSSMAIRVLSRRHLRRVLPSTPILIPPISLREIQPFSTPPDLRSQLVLESLESTKFSHQIGLASTLQRYGFPQCQIHEFIQKNRFLSKSSSAEVESCINLLSSFGLTQKSLLSIICNCPRALQPGFVDGWILALSELGFPTLSASLSSAVLEQSGRFGIEPDDFRRYARVMKTDLGFSDGTVIRVFEQVPAAFMKEAIDVSRRIEFLINFGINKEEIDRVCYKFPKFLAFSVEGRLRPLFQEFRDLGFSRNEVCGMLIDNPKLLLSLETGELSRCLELIRSLKCRAPIKEKILLSGHLGAGIEVKLRVDFLCTYGLIRRDAFKVLYVEPRSILYGLEEIEKKIDFLIRKMGFTVEHLVEFPEYLGVSLEKHIIPRFSVIEQLKSMDGLSFEVGLKHFARLSRLKFYNLYVKPYPECEKIFGGIVREKKARPRHPTGLWKMFAPEKFPDSKEDVRNMKLFVESLV